ncbi:Glutamyl-tRNA reductase [Xylanimonas cellulosilytica DSM 15894]|uniref:Glutamyl-tRNA reductase n=1 Tax=Xylanimonas cellulosilytica (strain DSM 15894 / JCM 12276 / CECT 5975 / KCTC 9989 / LMG 20990 / NBRC 107835 / XIL07) TaxID=446471 RepID=D1C0P5_XYLCX|nr:glutamyl-tRNA reductase [Xylanimonas cellulosilytica]ACZ32248.1 Glutamyl-tRNA reductase [Xylanimonas cellulosilytica DSM 15894]
MVLLSLTASHRELDLDALERLSSGSTSVARTIVGSCKPVQGAVVISTCNRFEIYLDVEAPMNGPTLKHATTHVAELIAAASDVTAETAAASFTVRTASEVPEHLFSVASGLDSMVIGEREIAGQVKRALEVARDEGTTSKTLELLFQTASRTSKRVGASTELGSTGRSIVKLALDLAADALPEWRSVRTILIGTGSYAGATVAALHGRGADDVRVYSQSGRAELFADGHDVVALGTDEESLVEALAEADLVVSVSGARGRHRTLVERTPVVEPVETTPHHPVVEPVETTPHHPVVEPVETTPHHPVVEPVETTPHHPVVEPVETTGYGSTTTEYERGPEASLEFVLDAAAVARARVRAAERAAARAGSADRSAPRPLVILDLALHRDVDPEVADVEGVLLYDLQALKAHAPTTAVAVVQHARELVDGAAREFADHQVGRAADAAVVALLDEAELQVRAEIAAAVERLRAELAARGEHAEPDEDDVDRISRDVRKRVHSALHTRIVEARAEAIAAARAAERDVADTAENLQPAEPPLRVQH